MLWDRDSLNDHIYWQLMQNGYLGVACEPNCVFQICIQPAILGFRLHDLITGGKHAEETVAGYERAWAGFGRLDENGHYNVMILKDSKILIGNEGASAQTDAWCGSLMNMWNREFVHEHYPRQIADYLVHGPDGTLSVPPASPADMNGQQVTRESDGDFGWLAAWASEMGDQGTRDGLLAHAGRFTTPPGATAACSTPATPPPPTPTGTSSRWGP